MASSVVETSSAPASIAASIIASSDAALRSNSIEADAVEHEGDGAGLGERAASLGEIGAHLARRAVAVVGQRLDDDGDAAGRIALVTHLVVVLGVGARGLLDRALDIVLGHVLGAGGEHGGAQTRVHVRVGQAHLGGDGDFAGELGEELGADRVLLALLVHDVLELTMPGHALLALLLDQSSPSGVRRRHIRRRIRK